MSEATEVPTATEVPVEGPSPTVNRRGWDRKESVEGVNAFDAAVSRGVSQRQFARQSGLPRTTLQHWLSRKRGLDSDPEVIAFFESPVGLAFLHRLVIAIQFGMSLVCDSGDRPIALVLHLAGLDPFVANSHGSRQKVGARLRAELGVFDSEQRAALCKQMTPKRISVCEDETFHPETCLVAIEPVSNFILLERYASARDAVTWNEAFTEATRDLPVTVCQSTSDEAKGLLLHVREGLGAHHGPDLFHVQQELTRATSVVLASQVRAAERAQSCAADQTESVRAATIAWQEAEHGPGRPPNFEKRLAEAAASEAAAVQSLAAARDRQERAHQAIRAVGKSYHPVALRTGALRTSEQLTADLELHFTEIDAVADAASLPERCRKGIQKARRLVPAMVCTLAFYLREVAEQVGTLGLSDEAARQVRELLVPAAYLARAAPKATPADTRGPLYELSATLRADAEPLLRALPPDRRATVERVVQDCADLFQRSSSCVEGRNGQLSLRHHSLHHLHPSHLRALTTVHNYFIQRPDRTTAAERFFGAKPADLFEWLLDHLDLPARPAASRRKQHKQHPAPLLN